MTENTQQQTGQAQPQGQGKSAPAPCADTPAYQPPLPKDKCEPPKDGPKAPEIPKPKPCPPKCDCPLPPPGTSSCLDELIRAQAEQSAKADSQKAFASELEALATKTKAALAEYTPDKYKQLLDRWKDEDKQIVDLIAKLVCAVPCWACVIECRVCGLYGAVRDLERRLDGCGNLCATVDSLYDLQYWQTRDRDAKKATLDRIKAILAAWEKPAATIDKVLTDNAALIASAGKTLAPDAPKLLYDVFMRLVPMHLLIAPPASTVTTGIDKKYTQLCPYNPCDSCNPCDPGTPDDCCGADTGVPSLLKRLLKPQPYLVPPDKLSTLLCCLIKYRYKPATEAYAEAVGALSATENEIKRTKADIDERTKALENDAKTALALPIDCCKEKPKDRQDDGRKDGDKDCKDGDDKKKDDKDCGCQDKDKKKDDGCDDGSSTTSTPARSSAA